MKGVRDKEYIAISCMGFVHAMLLLARLDQASYWLIYIRHVQVCKALTN
jgi:hypothetical protein